MVNEYQNEEAKFRQRNHDCYIPDDFGKVHKQYANLPEYLRRFCIFREIESHTDKVNVWDVYAIIGKAEELRNNKHKDKEYYDEAERKLRK